MLDTIDPDLDLEDTGDLEPNLTGVSHDGGMDAEDDSIDNEPSLGWPDELIDQMQPLRADNPWSVDCEADECGGPARRALAA